MKLLIVGGVAGGASAAARSRRLSEDADIVLFERGPDVSFANCGLPYYVGGEISDRDKLLLTTPERLQTRFKRDVRTRSSVTAIDRSEKKIHVHDLVSGREYEETYDTLILAPGAAPLRPSISGSDLPGIFTLRNLQDVDRIKERVNHGVQQLVVVGAGFIGLEMVENSVPPRRQPNPATKSTPSATCRLMAEASDDPARCGQPVLKTSFLTDFRRLDVRAVSLPGKQAKRRTVGWGLQNQPLMEELDACLPYRLGSGASTPCVYGTRRQTQSNRT